MDGILVVDKPAGPTSHDVVDRVRRALGIRRVGHAGTLDPFATGVLPVCAGKATRLARFLAGGEKGYQAVVRLGFATTTDDLTGEPLGPATEVAVPRERVEAACHALVGVHMQVPPVFSARRVAGRRLYELARAGEVVERPAKEVHIHQIRVFTVHGDRLEMEVRCSAGTYVRALARDLGQALGTGAHLVALRRTSSGGFGLEQAVPWVELTPSVAQRVIPLGRLLPQLPAVRVGPEGQRALRYGRDLTRDLVLRGFPESPVERLRVTDETGNLLALAVSRGFALSARGTPMEPKLHPDVVLLD